MSLLLDQLEEILGSPVPNRWHAVEPSAVRARALLVRTTVQRLGRIEAAKPLQQSACREFTNDGLTFREYKFRGRRSSNIDAQLISLEGADLSGPLVVFCQGRNVPPDYRPKLSAKELPTYGSHEFARAGFNTFMLDYGLVKGFDPELVGNRDEINLLGLALGLRSYCPLGLVVQNVLDALGWLGSQPWFDLERTVLFGRSLGGQIALHTALAYETPLTVALSSCVGTYRTMCARNVCAGASHFLPGILDEFDLPDLIAALCPRKLYIQVGVDDKTMPYDDAVPALEAVCSAYGSLAAADQLTIDSITGKGHATDIPSVVAYLREMFAGPSSQGRYT